MVLDAKWYDCKHNCKERDKPFCVTGECEHYETDKDVKQDITGKNVFDVLNEAGVI